MRIRNKLWKYATALVVVLIALNPETIELAVFVDSIGLEMFILLIEIQAMTVFIALFRNKIRPALAFLMDFIEAYILIFSWKMVKEKSEYLVLVVPSQATLMHMLVFSAVLYF